jgi:cytokinin dehydrogenase
MQTSSEESADVRSAQQEVWGTSDFGRIVHGVATDVIEPRTLEELAAAVRQARAAGTQLTLRGGGNSQSGQAVCAHSVCVDLRRLDGVEVDPARQSARCQPGLTWRKLVQETLRWGLLPRVVPLNLDLTLGGTLSVGGFGSTSHRFGAAVSNVTQLVVVDGLGEVRRCSASEQRELFDATLAGLGRCAVIGEATLALRRAPNRVRTSFLLYDDISQFLSHQRGLAASARVDHMEGLCSATMHGLHLAEHGRRTPLVSWSYCLQVSTELDEQEPVPDVLLGTRGQCRVRHAEDCDSAAFASRYDARFAAMRATGAEHQPHPWLECVLPYAEAAQVIPRALSMLPAFLGDLHRVSWVAASDRPRSLVFPQGAEWVTFAVLPAGVHPALLGDARRALKQVEKVLLEAGGKRYLSGLLDAWDEQAFRQHFGAHYTDWRAAKRVFDPSSVFTSALFSASGCQ